MSTLVGFCPCGFGDRIKPDEMKAGTTKFGFTVGEVVEVTKKSRDFVGWKGHVIAFDDMLVAVELDQPPPGHKPNGQWFHPADLKLV